MSKPLHFRRGSDDQVGKWFKAKEFDCHCSHCTETLVHPDLISRLDKLRDILGAKIIITSAYRCDYAQKRLRELGFETSKGRSQHQDGKAADIRSDCRSGADLTIFAAEAGFSAIGTGKDWIHVDTRDDKQRRWTYKG